MDILVFLIYLINIFTHVLCISNTVTKNFTWPLYYKNGAQFTIAQSYDKQSVLTVEIKGIEATRKFIRIDGRIFSDFTTEYFKIKKNIIKPSIDEFKLDFNFFVEAHNKNLIFRWFPKNVERDNTAYIESRKSVLYEDTIILQKEWVMSLSVEAEIDKILYNNEKYFRSGVIVKMRCLALQGIPKSSLNLILEPPFANDDTTIKKQHDFQSFSYNYVDNTAYANFLLTKEHHNRNISCIVTNTGQKKSYQLRVNHPPTAVKLSPEYTGYINNGSSVKCLPFDGYPRPSAHWAFVSAKNHSNARSLFKIPPETDSFFIYNSAPRGIKLIFKCTLFYRDPLNNKETTVEKEFSFVIGENPANMGIKKKIDDANAEINKDNTLAIYDRLNKAVIGAGVAGIVVVIIAVIIVVMVCRSQPNKSSSSSSQQISQHNARYKNTRANTDDDDDEFGVQCHDDDELSKYAGSLIAGSKSQLKSQMKKHSKIHNGSASPTSPPANDTTDYNYDDMPRGRRPIKTVDDNQTQPIVYSTIVGTMQPKNRPSLDIGPIDRV